jgi:hypothetical protein
MPYRATKSVFIEGRPVLGGTARSVVGVPFSMIAVSNLAGV